MEDEKDSNSNKGSWGGAREGAGRRKGSTNKLSARQILESAEQILDKPLIISLLEGYQDTILDGDRKHRVLYEKMLLDKVATQLLDVEVTDSEESIEARRKVFAEAIAQITTKNQDS